MTDLTIEQFPAFFRELWSHDPFPWQVDLLATVVADRAWPALVDLPTGTGKTSLVDLALFAMALDAAAPPDERWMPRRVAMVVDRRVIVDQAHDRAGAIRDKITALNAGPVCTAVRTRLASLSGDGPALLTSVLRGGIVRDESWARRPDVPAVLASTVDQVGSRLLFRGYGVSRGMRPIQAGLLSTDTLFLLDEVHLARPFADTLDRIARLREVRDGTGSVLPPNRSAVVQLSATPDQTGTSRFPSRPLDPGDHPVLRRRLTASKPADLVPVKVPADAGKANATFAKAVVALFTERRADHRRIAIMVNRVDTARRVAAALAELAGKGDGFDLALLTGRMRPEDRDRLFIDLDLNERLRPGPRNPDHRPLVVVATQSLEAGADFDFDLLLTECASLDALRQRFGRVDRDGQRSAAGQAAANAVLCRSTDAAAKDPDPIYGRALVNTWAWLETLPEVDFGYRAQPDPDPALLRTLVPQPERGPLLGASHLDRWAQTTQRQVAAEPEVAQWLHGVSATDAMADVQVIWRSGLSPELFRWDEPAAAAGVAPAGPSDDDLGTYVTELLAVCPPLAAEALPVPLGALRRWLRGENGDAELSDVATADVAPPPGRRTDPGRRLVARWEDGGATMAAPWAIRPGDTIVVPAAAGGLFLANWDPTNPDPVTDHSTALARRIRGQAIVHLTPEACAAAGVTFPDPDELEQLKVSERRQALRPAMDPVGAGTVASWGRWKPVLVTHGLDGPRLRQSYVIVTRLVDQAVGAAGRGGGGAGPGIDLAVDTADDALSLIGQAVTLDDHLAGVGDHAAAFATRLGWPDPLVRILHAAGQVHDVGKVDPRFQAILRGGVLPGLGDPLLAKSSSGPGDRKGRRAARQASGYPKGTRHELLSTAMIDGRWGPPDVADPDLLSHLVATHHGWGRYRFAPVVDRRPEAVTYPSHSVLGDVNLTASTDHGHDALNRGHADRYWRLTRRYGWWTLAQLETVLRLADHWRSHLEQQRQDDPQPDDDAGAER